MSVHRGRLVLRVLVQGVPGAGGGLIQGVSGPGGSALGVETPPIGYCCGRYASYWNAFLFAKISINIPVTILSRLWMSDSR